MLDDGLPPWAAPSITSNATESPLQEDISYDEFRTGLDFADVRAILKHEQDEAYANGQYMFVSRSTVLGRWFQIKQTMWAAYQATTDP